MAKITIPDILSGYQSTTTLNNAFNSIESELNNKVLYRDNPSGEPNQMESDIDMNGFTFLNVGGLNLATFTAVYLGVAAADPTQRSDGTIVVEGDLYFNSLSKTMKVYTGTTWVAAFTSLSGGLIAANNLNDVPDPSAARVNLGLEIAQDVQAWSANLDDWTNKLAPSSAVVGTADTQTLTNKTLTSPAISGGTLASSTITGGSVNNTPIGGTTPNTGAFTTLVSNTSIGYAGTGTGGAVTQLTSKGTSVTLNKICGQIITSNAALAAATEVVFTVTNSTVTSTDVPVVALVSGGTAGAYSVTVDGVSNGSFNICISNLSASSLSQALTINFVVIKSVSA